MTPEAPAVPEDEALWRQVLVEGGLAIETSDAAGTIQFRTLVQLDGDTIHWVRRPPKPLPPTGPGSAGDDTLGEAHLAKVAAHVDALGSALGRLGDQAKRWIHRARMLSYAISGASWLTATVGAAGHHVALSITTGTLGTVAFVAARWLARPLGRFILRHVAHWAGHKAKTELAKQLALQP